MFDEAVNKTCSFDVCCLCTHSCCQDAKPPLTSERKKIIASYLQKQKLPITNPFTHEDYSYPAVDAMGFCIFYNKETKKCLVHPVKPETCRAGPVTFDINRRTQKVEWYLKTAELCALAHVLHENKPAFNAHFEIAKKDLLTLIQKLDSKALQAILKIEEPQTFKIGEADLPEEAAEKLEIKQPPKQ
ncbi:YkgJ family cysteine cluster protein [Candidatus Bathyarchaeota archaeon]|nr:YkgJ family cysteine cluster protein [Candidatus Bathyarchaeota archaeon]